MDIDIYRDGIHIGTMKDLQISRGELPPPDQVVDLEGTGSYYGKVQDFSFKGITVREATPDE